MAIQLDRNVQVIGLGRMGGAVAERLKSKFDVQGFDPSPEASKRARTLGIETASSLAELVLAEAKGNHLYWLMLPAGKSVDETLEALDLSRGDIVIDGGNSHYRDSIRRSQTYTRKGVAYLDVGTSGGLGGRDNGFCLMVGGNADDYRKLEPMFRQVAAEQAVSLVGPAGAGHYVKMVHNAIEYGILQVLGEGFWMLEKAPYTLAPAEIAALWSRGSVIRGWLVELAAKALQNEKQFSGFSDSVGGGETGKWAAQDALERDVPIPLITQALQTRFASVAPENLACKLVAALRYEFGGHEDVSGK